MFCVTFQFPDEFLFSFDTQELEVRKASSMEVAETKKCNDGSSSDERSCARRTICETQIGELEPELKKSKFS